MALGTVLKTPRRDRLREERWQPLLCPKASNSFVKAQLPGKEMWPARLMPTSLLARGKQGLCTSIATTGGSGAGKRPG